MARESWSQGERSIFKTYGENTPAGLDCGRAANTRVSCPSPINRSHCQPKSPLGKSPPAERAAGERDERSVAGIWELGICVSEPRGPIPGPMVAAGERLSATAVSVKTEDAKTTGDSARIHS
jgi:hypothetical protein